MYKHRNHSFRSTGGANSSLALFVPLGTLASSDCRQFSIEEGIFFVKLRHLNSLLFFWKPLVYLLHNITGKLYQSLCFFGGGLFQMCLLTCLSLLPPLQKYSGHFILLLDSEAVFSACLTLLVIYIKTRLKEKVCLPQVEKPMVCPSFASLSNPLLKLF